MLLWVYWPGPLCVNLLDHICAACVMISATVSILPRSHEGKHSSSMCFQDCILSAWKLLWEVALSYMPRPQASLFRRFCPKQNLPICCILLVCLLLRRVQSPHEPNYERSYGEYICGALPFTMRKENLARAA